MKYLKNRDVFLTGRVSVDSSPVNEVLQNDIAWGDSLLGRLINSVARKAKIGFNLKRIDSVVDALKREFDNLIDASKINSVPKEGKVKIETIKIYGFLDKLEEAVNDEENIDSIIMITESLIGYCETYKSVGDNVTVDEITSRANDFLAFLNDKKKSESKDVKGGEGKDVKGEEDKDVKRIEGVPVQKTLDIAHKNMPVVISVPVDQEKGSKIKKQASMKIADDKFEFLYPNASDEQKKRAKDLYAELNGTVTKTDKNKLDLDRLKTVIDKINVLFSELGGDPIRESNLYLSYYDFLNELNNVPVTTDNKDNLPATTDNKDNLPATTDKTDNLPATTDNKDNKKDEQIEKEIESIKMAFDRIFDAEFLKKCEITQKDITEVDGIIGSVDSKEIVINGIDPIIEIVKLFNRAYKIHTTTTIPSGRSGGKISNMTFNEYTYLGSGSGGTPDNPGTGPYRNDKLFDKWENAVMDIIKDSKYQVLFNKNCTIKVGEADKRVNVTETANGEVQGGGKVLLSFINAMLDGDSLYKKGAQAAFIEKYFKVDVSKSGLGIGDDVKTNADNAGNTKPQLKFAFKSGEIKEFSEGSVFAIKGKSKEERTYYVCVLRDDKEEAGKIVVAFSSSLYFLKRYYKSIGVVSQGDLLSKIVDVEKSAKKTDDGTTEVTYKVYLSKFLINKLSKTSILPIKSVTNGKEEETPKTYNFNVKDIYKLVDESGSNLVINDDGLNKLKKPDSKFTKVKSTGW